MLPDRQVLVVEDDALLRGMLVELLAGRGFVVHEAHDAESALDMLDDYDPDALVIDLDLGNGPSGIDVIGALGDRIEEFGVLVLSNYPTPWVMGKSAHLPASVGYLVKHKIGHPSEVMAALEGVLTNAAIQPPSSTEDVTEELAGLTPRQLELLRLIAMGYSNDAIAEKRGVTVRSVESLVSRLFVALDLSGDTRGNARVRAAMLYARTMGIPRSDEP